jgi:hypothetical protein
MVRKRTLRSLVFLNWQPTLKEVFIPVAQYDFNFLYLRKFDSLDITKN